jgi:hypothetical protein
MWSASALKRFCAHPNILNKTKVVTPDQQVAMDRGTAFHAAAETWLRTGVAPEVEDLEIQGWLDALIAQFPIPAWAKLEIAWGLTPDMKHAMVAEPQPHKYESMNGAELLTAGRADIVWIDEVDDGTR